MRESSLWTDEDFFRRLDSLRERTDLPSDVHDTRGLLRAGTSFAERLLRDARAYAAWGRALGHALVTRVSASREGHHSSTAYDVMLVEYLPDVYTRSHVDRSQYFGELPALLRNMSKSVGYLHLHASGPVTRPNKRARAALRALNETHSTHHLVSDALSLGTWWRAWRVWRRLRRVAPRAQDVRKALAQGSDAEKLWPSWRKMYENSVFGTRSVRTVLLTAMFEQHVRRQPESTVWISAFEGQGWESCLARSVQSRGAVWVAYLHTMMRPWDLRARSFLCELRPSLLAVHGAHDRAELEPLGVPLVVVEALRYAHLAGPATASIEGHASVGVDSGVSNEKTWLIIGGAECERSNRELSELVAALHKLDIQRQVLVRWHPQCGKPVVELARSMSLSHQPLVELTRDADVAILVGSAAPLDTYLAGVPTCAFRAPSGYDMSPLVEGDYFMVASDGSDVISWAVVAENRPRSQPDVGEFFVLDSAYPRWRQLLATLPTASRED